MSNFLPIWKLGLFLAQSAIKPVSKLLIGVAKHHPKFDHACKWITHKNYRMYVKISDWSGNKLQITEALSAKYKNMTTEDSIDFCTNLVGELLFVSMGVGLIIYEFRNKKRRNAKASLSTAVEELYKKIEVLEKKQDVHI